MTLAHTQVEMFVVSTPQQSEALHQELIDIETEMFTELGLMDAHQITDVTTVL